MSYSIIGSADGPDICRVWIFFCRSILAVWLWKCIFNAGLLDCLDAIFLQTGFLENDASCCNTDVYVYTQRSHFRACSADNKRSNIWYWSHFRIIQKFKIRGHRLGMKKITGYIWAMG